MAAEANAAMAVRNVRLKNPGVKNYLQGDLVVLGKINLLLIKAVMVRGRFSTESHPN